MEYTTGYLLALLVVAVGFLGIILALLVLEVSVWKFFVSLLLSLIAVGLGGYYYYVVFQTEKGVINPNKLNVLLSQVIPAPKPVMPLPLPQEIPGVQPPVAAPQTAPSAGIPAKKVIPPAAEKTGVTPPAKQVAPGGTKATGKGAAPPKK
ncbi:MAG: hypothetical protein V2A65_00245 [Candidatus Omnitrophota bacterium]